MIILSTGEVDFDDGLRIVAHSLISHLLEAVPAAKVVSRALPIEGWSQHFLGEYTSAYGTFEVEVATGIGQRVEGVFLSHVHPFYDATPEDSERRAFHEGVISSDLLGAHEFSWGYVLCKLDTQANRDWLVVIYSPYSGVPIHQREAYRALIAHEPKPIG